MINKALVDATPSEICALIKIVELGLQRQTSDEMADKSQLKRDSRCFDDPPQQSVDRIEALAE